MARIFDLRATVSPEGKPRVIALETAEMACEYEFDEIGRLVPVAEPKRKIVFNYSTSSSRNPESVWLDGQTHGLKFDRHGNVLAPIEN